MPKISNVTRDQLAEFAADMDDATITAQEMHDRIRGGYIDADAATIRQATVLLGASRKLADLSAQLLFVLRHAEDLNRNA
jgi:hypothetical protein